MKFKETKYNIGDKLYKISGNEIREYIVSGIRVCIGRECNGHCTNSNGETHLYELNYLVNQYTSYISEENLERKYFTSKKDLMLSMFPDEFEDGLIVK